MKTFKVDIFGYLEAEDLEDAFSKISQHFLNLSEGGEDDLQIFSPDSRLSIEDSLV